MRNGFALFAGAALLVACGGGEKPAAEPAVETPAAAPAAAPTTPAPTGAVAAAPVTGKVHEIKMVGDDKGYRYEPNAITIAAGDGLKFIMVSGGPHNVAFDAATVPEDVKGQLAANMPNNMGNLDSPMFMTANEAYEVSFANIKPGKYGIFCTPHLAMGMKMEVTVQ